ncbi:phospholipase D-like domain-containing protein [Rhizobium sp. CNPSo 3464]|uniref:phospholipase D-like domain-containing protein n=1 Tax=Rhizobium sp. CNPSo 3464 TaxID=3021406 RepID=UPI00254EA90A|nr:phospholipase D-like domain-containing protein [Rhizobium sp. CNPSo 3464]MDK4742677.1 phospholipase D-like domain-containing protein [Rhizobium sp. CNPSo 3464]
MSLKAEDMRLEGIAARTAFLINGSAYFSRLAHILRRARRRVWIVGWDFNPDIRLQPENSKETLGDLLHALVDANPDLEVRILIWALGPLYSEKSLKVLRKINFPKNSRIDLRFAMQPAIRGCHHQKLVCIDDSVAFIGGIDLTSRRWDTWVHRVRDKLKRDPDGVFYEPLHDLQTMVTGDAARLIASVARRRWMDATGEECRVLTAQTAIDWPDDLSASLENVPVKLAITEPVTFFKRGLRQGIAVTKNVIAKARRQLYIETQYLASFNVAEAIAARLREEDGPEVVIICTRKSHGLIENFIMGKNRDRIVRRLMDADRHGRLRIFYPVVPDGEKQVELLVHSKLLIADDNLLRIGSSNLNHRSEGLDTECDILFQAHKPTHRLAIDELRNMLVAEYLGCAAGAVRNAFQRSGSLIHAIAELNVGARCLKPLATTCQKTGPIAGTALFDPARPLGRLGPRRLVGHLRRILRSS